MPTSAAAAGQGSPSWRGFTGVRWSVEADSWWYPEHTVRIVFDPGVSRVPAG